MAGHAGCREFEAKDALLAAADAVIAAAVELERAAGTLVDQQIAANLVGVLLGQPAGADITARLLVGDEDELQRSPRGAPAAAPQRDGGDRFGRDLRLHVDRAAAPEVAVHNLAAPGVVLPVLDGGQDGVDVTEVDHRRAVFGGSPERGDQVRALWGGGQQLGLEAGLAHVGLEELDGCALVARRVDRVEADQLLQYLSRFGLELGGHGVGGSHRGPAY